VNGAAPAGVFEIMCKLSIIYAKAPSEPEKV
jgi:hypothetical protein